MQLPILLILFLFLSTGCIDDGPRSIQYKQGEFWVDKFRNNSFTAKAFKNEKIYCSSIEIAGDKPNYLYCLNVKTGIVEWACKVDNWSSDPPIITDSFLYYSTYVGDIYKLDRSGREIWKVKLNGSFSGHALNPLNKNLFVRTIQNGVFEFDVADGKTIHHYGKNTLGVTLPVFFENKMYIGGLKDENSVKVKGEYLYCFDANSRSVIWKKNTGEYVERLFINDNKIYFLDYGHRLNCISTTNGETLWTSDSLKDESGFYSLNPHMVFQNSRIFYYDSDLNTIYEFESSDGSRLGRFSYWEMLRRGNLKPTKRYYTVEGNGRLYNIVVSDSLETPDEFGKTYSVFIEKIRKR